ncbi:MAG: hypothetical protein OXC72_02970 [Roseovarius sp.]|nr:hypothetical protein [Roseovarius sp.]
MTPRGKGRAPFRRRPPRNRNPRPQANGLLVHGFRTLLDDLPTVVPNEMRTGDWPERVLPIVAEPRGVQRKAFDLLNVKASRNVPTAPPG